MPDSTILKTYYRETSQPASVPSCQAQTCLEEAVVAASVAAAAVGAIVAAIAAAGYRQDRTLDRSASEREWADFQSGWCWH